MATMVRARLVYGAAAALTAAALVLPLWGFSMSAPQYPGETLQLRVARQGIVGDVQEVDTLQQYIGVRFPTDLPELSLAVRGIAGLVLLLVIAGIVGGRFGRIYRASTALLFTVFLIAAAVMVQARLYEVGHHRNPRAPIRAVPDFTPPLVGPVKVGNFTVWSFPHVGGVALVVAAALAISGVRLKRDATKEVRLPSTSLRPGKPDATGRADATEKCGVRLPPSREASADRHTDKEVA